VTPERWERIEALYHDAEALPPDRRDEFLAEACGNDHDLRRDVASLLDEPVSPGGFLSQPAILRAAHMLGDAPAASMTGRSVGRYQLHALIGAGGMGEVYHSHDATLARDVAVKILPPAFINDSDRLARLEREARMLAAVNHPNICAIYGVEEANGIRFLLLELVEGDTLADRLVQAASPVAAGLPLPEVLNIARQLADALEAAHDKGIIHRDLKPANIKITPQGLVKVLDFGLAKSLAAGSAPDITHVPDGKMGQEADGAVVGTAAYMSPEQARGSRVDSRTDIWAFGCVLFEMLTGRLPFAGGTASDTIAKILEREPDWTALPAETPAAIRRVLLRCLVKDPKKRIRDIGDVRLEIDAVDEVLPEFADTRPAAAPHGRRTSSLLWLALAAVVTAVAVVEWRRPAVQENPLEDAKTQRLTNWEGNEGGAAISPDGKFVAFLADRAGEFDVWVTQIGTLNMRNLTLDVPPLDPPTMLRAVGFTADGEIWFTPSSPGGPAGQKLLVPITGGPGRPLLGANAVALAWSWDGNHLAYFENDEGDPLFVADGAAADPIAIIPPGSGFPHHHNPVWSFDDLWVYFTRGFMYALNETDELDIWRVRPTGGAAERMTTVNTDIMSMATLDARTLLYVGRSENREGPWIWALDTVTKARRRISSGLERYSSVAASRDGRRIVATLDNTTTSLWSIPLDRPAQRSDVKRYDIPSGQAVAPRFGPDALFYLSWNESSEGDGLFRLQDGVSTPIWRGSDGTLSVPPAISRDGKRVALVVRREGKQHLSVMLADGTGRRALAPAIDTQGTADWSPDGSWIVIGGSDSAGPGLFKVPVDGGQPVRLLSTEGTNPIWSPDGGLIVYGGPLVAGQVPLMAMRPDGQPVQLPKLPAFPGGYRFMPNGRQIIYLPRIRLRTFWMLDLDTNTTRELIHVADTGRFRTFDITPDGKQLVFDLSQQNGDIVLIERRDR
jgi:Tol biopolymer transport system component